MAEHQAEANKRKSLSPQCKTLLRELEAGGRLTPLIAAYEFGVMALSQRMGDLRRAGYPVVSEMVKLPSGKRVARYSLAKEAANA
jgi:hypothetical protein